MTWKTSDPASIPVYLYDQLGRALTYASAAAFQAAGWSINWVQNGVDLSNQPTYTITPDPNSSGLDGKHYVGFNLPQGVTTMALAPPATGAFSPQAITLLIVCANDEDSLAAGFAQGAAIVSANGGTTTLPDQSVTEGNAFSFQLPALVTNQLSFFASTSITVYANLADIGGQPWTVKCQARRIENGGQLDVVPVAFVLGAGIQSKPSSILVIGWDSPPVGAQIDDLQATATASLTSQVVTSIAVNTAGMYFSAAPTVAITGGAGTGATAVANLVNGQVASITVTAGGSGYTGTPTVTLSTPGDGSRLARRFLVDVQVAPPVGSTFAGSLLTVFSFGLNINRRQTTP